jgi:hypothetical protein
MVVEDWISGGCQVFFTRADMLKNHHCTPMGQARVAKIRRDAQLKTREEMKAQKEAQIRV